jgi:DNA-binding MarR family transcriptional regulator
MIQLRTAIFINEKGTVKPTDIARKFSITPASVTSQIDTLVKEGIIIRKFNSDDKRVIEVALTKRGEDVLEKNIRELNDRCSWISDSLTLEEQKELLNLTMRINSEFSDRM